MNIEDEMKESLKQEMPKTDYSAGHSYKNDSVLSSVPKLITELSASKLNIDWVWEGYIAKGHLTFFSALWKVGKSTLISHLLRSIQTGVNFAGHKVTPVKILILSEESENIWVGMREDLGLSGDVYIDSRPTIAKLTSDQWQKFIKKNFEFCKERGIELIVFDTISTFWPVRDEGNNPELDGAIIPLNLFLEKNIAVLLVHHFRKSGGQEGTATRGGGGLGSRADILLEFTRLDATNINSTQRIIRSYSRFEETPLELVIELIDNEYVARGTKSEVSREAKLQNVLSLINESRQSMSINDLVGAWDEHEFSKKPSSRSMRRYIDSLLQDNRVIQSGTQNKGKTTAPTYKLNNVGQDSESLYKASGDNHEESNVGNDDLENSAEVDIEPL